MRLCQSARPEQGRLGPQAGGAVPEFAGLRRHRERHSCTDRAGPAGTGRSWEPT